MSTVLVVAAHPDDELLGCGGTIARHTESGDLVHVLILAEGARARHADGGTASVTREVSVLQDAARAAAEITGATEPRFGGLPDNRMDGVELLDVIRLVEETLDDVGADTVYTHHGGDLNVDHQLTHRAVVTATRPVNGCEVRSVYAYETLSSTEWGITSLDGPFVPTRFCDVSRHLETKIRALACYEGEMRRFPHPRSVETVRALAAYRGATSGLAAAEAFEVVREIR